MKCLCLQNLFKPAIQMWPPFLSPLKWHFLGFSLLTIVGFSHTAFDLKAYSHSGHYRQWKECFAPGVLQSSQTPSIPPPLAASLEALGTLLPPQQGNACHSRLLFSTSWSFQYPQRIWQSLLAQSPLYEGPILSWKMKLIQNTNIIA